jgi:uncharacterized protein
MSDALAALRAEIDADPTLAGLLRVASGALDDDPGHDLEHALRVTLWTLRLGGEQVVRRHAVAAGLFHDLVNVPKDHADRARASELCAEAARPHLRAAGFAADEVELVAEAIVDHSFSRGAVPRSHLGRALQDADRLEALGVLGVFRTISTGTKMGARYFDARDPWAEARPLDDLRYSIDHFETKLLKLAPTLCTEEGRAEAERRAARMRTMLEWLGQELGRPYRVRG